MLSACVLDKTLTLTLQCDSNFTDMSEASENLRPGQTKVDERPRTVPKAKTRFDFGGKHIFLLKMYLKKGVVVEHY